MDWVCAEAVEARMKSACFGFSEILGARFSRRRFVLAFLGFLQKQKVSKGFEPEERSREGRYIVLCMVMLATGCCWCRSSINDGGEKLKISPLCSDKFSVRQLRSVFYS